MNSNKWRIRRKMSDEGMREVWGDAHENDAIKKMHNSLDELLYKQ